MLHSWNEWLDGRPDRSIVRTHTTFSSSQHCHFPYLYSAGWFVRFSFWCVDIFVVVNGELMWHGLAWLSWFGVLAITAQYTNALSTLWFYCCYYSLSGAKRPCISWLSNAYIFSTIPLLATSHHSFCISSRLTVFWSILRGLWVECGIQRKYMAYRGSIFGLGWVAFATPIRY